MLFLCLGASAWASPFWSLDYLYQDIMRAKEGRHRIYEVQVDSCEYIREDTAQVPNRTLFLNIPADELDDTTAQPFDVYKLRFKVLSTITADPFPVHIPLVAFDKRMQSRFVWEKCSGWKWPKSADFIVVLDDHGRIVAIYPEFSQITVGKGKYAAVALAGKEEIQKETLRILDSKEYADFLDRKNVLRILEKHGVIR